MREKAKKILFENLKFQGCEQILFSSGKITDKSALIETVIDAMMDFKNLNKSIVINNKPKLSCRLHLKRKSCRLFTNNRNACKTCPHFTE